MKDKVKDFLEQISIGKYNHGLYLGKRLQYSSWVGGVMTIAIAGFFLIFSVFQIVDVFQRKTYNIQTQIEDITTYDDFKQNINNENFEGNFIQAIHIAY